MHQLHVELVVPGCMQCVAFSILPTPCFKVFISVNEGIKISKLLAGSIATFICKNLLVGVGRDKGQAYSSCIIECRAPIGIYNCVRASALSCIEERQ